jgi:hypothetical protein
MQVTIQNIATVETASLVAFYNEAKPEAPVKKFASRAIAEKRVLAILESEAAKDAQVDLALDRALDAGVDAALDRATAEQANIRAFAFENSAASLFPSAADFLAATDTQAIAARLFPVGFSSIFAPKVESTAVVPFGWDKVEADIFRVTAIEFTRDDGGDEIELYSGESKSDAGVIFESAKAEDGFSTRVTIYRNGEVIEVREVDPVYPESDEQEQEQEESEEEEAARMAAEAQAEGDRQATRAQTSGSRARGSNSLGVALSWQDKEVRAARLTRDGVMVTVNGVTTGHQSVRAAFTAYGLPDPVHIRFRLKLKASRNEVFEFNGIKHVFHMPV